MALKKGVIAAVLCCLVLVGCETKKSNLVGSGFVDRDPGQVVEAAPINMSTGESFQEVVLPIVLGEREELLVGQMNGFVYRSLLRFRIPVDSLSALSSGTGTDFHVDSLRVVIGLRSVRLGTNAGVSVEDPQTDWEEIATFVDSLLLVEKQVVSTPILGVTTRVVGDTSLVVSLPVGQFESARTKNAQTPVVNLLLQPNSAGDFLFDFISRQAAAVNTINRHPKVVVYYRVKDVPGTFTGQTNADTYWGARENGGPNRNTMLLSKGTFFSPILNFEIPASIPKGATINSAKLELDIDLDRSFYTSMPFEIYHVEFKPTENDTVYTRYNTQQNLETGQTSVIFNQGLVEAWLTGAQVNQGMALRALGSPIDMTWVRFRGAKLKLIYSLPPEL